MSGTSRHGLVRLWDKRMIKHVQVGTRKNMFLDALSAAKTTVLIYAKNCTS